MITLAVFHIVMLLLAGALVSGFVSPERLSNAISYLHKATGITTPTLQQGRMAALIWIASATVIVDGCILLLLLVVSLSKAG